MNLKDMSWEVFSRTGSVEMYLLYRSVENKVNEKCQHQGNNNKTDKLR